MAPEVDSQQSTGPTLQIDDTGLATIVFDDPERKLNVLTREVLATLNKCIDQLEEQITGSHAKVLIIRSGKPSFLAGADVSAIASIGSAEEGAQAARTGQALFSRITKLRIPTVAAVHGFSMGGGTELALACQYRVLSDHSSTRFVLPEVQLGILPGWGGTSRLPRLIGLQASLDLLLTGKACRASKALRIGMADVVFPHTQFTQRGASWALGLVDGATRLKPRRRRLLSRLLDNTPPGRALVLRMAKKGVVKLTGGNYPAPLRILDVAGRGLGKSLEANLELEAKALGDLVASPECKNLVHVFHLREGAKKGPWAPDAEALPVEHIGVIGAGIMGGGIAQIAAYNGISARMKDIRHEAVTSGLSYARGIFDKAVSRRKLSKREADQKMSLISGGIEYSGLQNADLIVEAVVERMHIKKAVWAEVEGHVSETAVLATNTSSLSVTEMATALKHQGRFAGMHFFNPVHRMPLVEVIRGAETTDETVQTVAALAVALGKVPVVAGDGPGFLVNRILAPYLNEAGFLLDEGFDGATIDKIWTRFGMPMGPYRLMDEVGIDVIRHAGETMYEAFGERMVSAASLYAIGESGRLGKKGKLGFYHYDKGKTTGFDATVYEAANLPASRTTPDPTIVKNRLVLSMINEAARILGDGIVKTAGDVDLGMIMGTGFPPFRGGLLRYADSLGVSTVLRELRKLEKAHGLRFQPSEALGDVARSGTGFYETYPSTT